MKSRKKILRKRLAKERRGKVTAAEGLLDQNQESTSTPSSAFKHKQTKFCSLKRADKGLPKSPHKEMFFF